jgi:pyrroline-5-carboxylate reductase
MLKHQKIGLIGAGNMGTSILEGVLKRSLATPSRIWVYDKIAAKAKAFSRFCHVRAASSITELLKNADIVLLAVKPQDLYSLATEHRASFRAGQCLISILAGITTDKIEAELGRGVTGVRAMPNLGAKVGQSMTVLCGKNKKSNLTAAQLFSGCGEVVTLPEKALDLVTALSGSGPAYFFHLMELLEAFGVKKGLSPKIARILAIQTGLGAVLLAKHSQASCAELRQMVTSKKGTTEAALKTLQCRQFGKIFHEALAAAMDRSRQLLRKS